MKIEHFSLNVEDPPAMTEWYVEHLGLRVIEQDPDPPYMTFLTDDSGRVMLEIYRNPPNEVPDYRNMDIRIVHIAFVSEDTDADKKRLLEAGASVADELHTDDGSHMVMLRDPWGLSIQFWERTTPMLAESDEDVEIGPDRN